MLVDFDLKEVIEYILPICYVEMRRVICKNSLLVLNYNSIALKVLQLYRIKNKLDRLKVD